MVDRISPNSEAENPNDFQRGRPSCQFARQVVAASQRIAHGGFTMIDLLVVIATTGLLLVIVLPTLAFSKGRPQVAQCLSNHNQMVRACAMYTSDYRELYPPNPDGGGTPGYDWIAGNAEGWAALSAGGSSEAGDATYLTNSEYCVLAPYLGHSAVPFKCPADWRVCKQAGKIVPVVRSVSANAGVGTVDSGFLSSGGESDSGPPVLPVPGAWLTGNHSESYSVYATFGKTTSFKNCRPSEIWIYADEDPLSINDGCLNVTAKYPQVLDWPSTRHQNAACFAFCDGHSELHKWQSNAFVINAYAAVKTIPPGVGTNDWFWFAWHATRSFTTGTVP